MFTCYSTDYESFMVELLKHCLKSELKIYENLKDKIF